MMVVSISGAISHYREGNINVPAGVTVGLFGAVGAVAGADIGQNIPEHILKPAAGFALWFLAFLGVGMAPFIQLGLLTVFRLSLVKTIGTTMLALIFISTSGSVALARHGDVSLEHLVGATIGMTAGSFIGAKWTRKAPVNVLRVAIVLTPF